MGRGKHKHRPAPVPDIVIITRAEYDSLSRKAALLDIILHDHTPYHEAVGIVKNVLITNGQSAEAGGAE